MNELRATQPPSYLNEALSAFGAVMDDPKLVEVCINPNGTVWVEKQGESHMIQADRRLFSNELNDLARRIAGAANETLGKARPLVAASITYKGRPIRAQVISQPAVSHGSAISLRFFSSLPLDEIELQFLHGAEYRVDDERRRRNTELRKLVRGADLETALRFCVQEKLNIILAGGTSTGKTVMLRKMLSFVPSLERIVTIEEAAELHPPQPNVVSLMASREEKVRTPDELLTASLRLRPDRLIVGEVRGKEAMTFLEAINTGHGGSMTTLHAESPQLALARLAIAGLKAQLPMTYQDMMSYIEGSIDVIIQTGRDDGRRGVAEFYLPGQEQRSEEKGQ
ncbi:ATPase, T2SS/T4P/T4SS family [uncultured Brevundimonas sp.]|uniref:ATPase, T2SS/T4P/T4SS family n=1 Tax=uncultured Brevundimonas sp. TaxID=213418 RepID=UPI002610CCD9|nr:ATPase, T2SS/T4P/T4SS family [uncultured Brevundimonas sp.]